MARLPPVNDLLEGRFAQAASRFMSPAHRLHIIYPIVSEDTEWAKRLEPAFKDLAHCERAVETNGALVAVLNQCSVSGDWAPLFADPAFLWRRHLQLEPQGHVSDEPDCMRPGGSKAWEAPYRWPGTLDLLSKYLRDMSKGKTTGQTGESHYPKVGAILQGSGTGKSRLIYEYGSAWIINYHLPTDGDVRQFFVFSGHSPVEVEERCLLFFSTLLEAAAILLQARVQQNGKFSDAKAAASWWHRYIHRNRRLLYPTVVKQAEDAFRGGSEGKQPASNGAQAAMDTFLRMLEAAVEEPDQFPVKVVICFDDAHELRTTVVYDEHSYARLPVPGLPTICKALDVFRDSPAAVLLLSTHFNLAYRYSAHHWTRWIEKLSYQPFWRFTWHWGAYPMTPSPSTISYDALIFNGGLTTELVLDFAKRQLSPRDPSDPIQVREARIAVIAIPTNLIRPNRFDIPMPLLNTLSARHMLTTAWDHTGEPNGRYLPEPFLAEAASSLLSEWEANEPDLVISTASSVYWDYPVACLDDANELGVRILLTSAYRRACRQDQDDTTGPTVYSKGCRLKTFLQCLFVRADEALNARPDNLQPNGPDGVPPTLDEALGEAIVRFTSFYTHPSEEPPSQQLLHRLFLKGLAVFNTCRKQHADVVIPVIVRKEGAMCVHIVTALFIGTRNCRNGGLNDELAIEPFDLCFFRKNPEPCACGGSDSPLTGRVDLARLPYVSILMDLGKQVRTPARMRVRSEKALEDQYSDSDGPDEAPRRLPVVRHPRYSMFVRGCTPALLCGVTSANMGDFARLLELSGDDSDHPAARHRRFWVGGMSRAWFYGPDYTPPPLGDEEAFYVGKWGEVKVTRDLYSYNSGEEDEDEDEDEEVDEEEGNEE
ncbi:hypothetical protein BC834DRAFT_885246 [Gloeopeniophorella convolvens]|nr:hypothetical protein BC834DRAFT_885246 [Gloeopeniophorella convolvens]